MLVKQHYEACEGKQMTKARAILESSCGEYLSIELDDEEQVIIGCYKPANAQASEWPDYDLRAILPPDKLEDVARRHAILTYKEGDFWVKSLGEHAIWLGPYVVTPGFFFRMFDGDTLRFGQTALTICIPSVGEAEKA
jgi:hypothetical protein